MNHSPMKRRSTMVQWKINGRILLLRILRSSHKTDIFQAQEQENEAVAPDSEVIDPFKGVI